MQGMQASLPGSFPVREAVQQVYGFSGEVERNAQVGSRQSCALVLIVLYFQAASFVMPRNFRGSVVSEEGQHYPN